jgi:hypothetical protein
VKRFVGFLVVAFLVGGAVWIGALSNRPRPSSVSQAPHTASPSPIFPTVIPVMSCNDVRIPRNVELDTGIDRETGLLTVNYTKPGTAVNLSVTVAYRNANCSWPQNRSIRKVIVHALTTPLEEESRGTYVVAKCSHPVHRPVHMVLACADFGLRANNLDWSTWKRDRAEGQGSFVMKDFTAPEFGIDRRQGTVRLSGRRYCIGLERFTFWRGTVVLDRPVEGQTEIDLYPACGFPDSVGNPSPPQFGWGAVPTGDQRVCPKGKFAEPNREETLEAAADLMAATNGRLQEPKATWSLLDRSLRQMFRSFRAFSVAMRSHVEPVYQEWGFSEEIGFGRVSFMPEVSCDKEVLKATSVAQAYFPRFNGVSGGAVQLYFVARPSGPKLWFAY